MYIRTLWGCLTQQRAACVIIGAVYGENEGGRGEKEEERDREKTWGDGKKSAVMEG